MFDYARSDTHFLLYIYDNMRNQLLERSDLSQPDGDLIDVVLSRSKGEALQRYERPFYDAQRGTGAAGWYSLLCRTPTLFNREQFAVFRAVHQWRDNVAREEDESVHLIMPKHSLFNIAREIPMDKASLLGCSHPISSLLRSHAGELLDIVGEAKKTGANGPDLKELLYNPETIQQKGLNGASNPGPAVVAAAHSDVSLTQYPKSDSPVRTNSSHFWGPTVNGVTLQHQQPRTDMAHNSLRLALPLPQLTAEIFAKPDSAAAPTVKPSQVDPGARAEHEYVKERKSKENDVFIVKQAGGSRKRKAVDLQEPREPVIAGAKTADMSGTGHNPDDEMEISLNDVNGEQIAHDKAERKAARKAQKKLDKEKRISEMSQRMNGGSDEQGLEGTEAFDYVNAPSVLHAKRDSNDRPGHKKPFDPYAKSMDAPKGMRKSKKEMAGASFTFKS